MGSWVDFLAFTLTLAAFVGVIIGVRFAAKRISSTVSATKESLKDRGWTISNEGVSVRTSSRYTREDYLDATQRGFIKAMGASSFNKVDDESNGKGEFSNEKKKGKVIAPSFSRHASSTSVNSVGSVEENGKGSKRKRLGLLRRSPES